MATEYIPCCITQIENIGCPIDGNDNRHDTHHGKNDRVNEFEQPSLVDGLLFVISSFRPLFEIITNTCNGQDTSELHDPPNQQLNAQQRITDPRADDGSHKHGQRNVCIKYIYFWNVGIMSVNNEPLPNGAY